MDTFHFIIDSPKSSEPEKIAEHLPPAIRYTSIDPITNIRMLSKDLKEDDVPFDARPDIAQAQKDLPFKHHIAFKSRHTIRTWLADRETG